MRNTQRNFHTRYHVMEASGVFDENPANPTSRDNDGMTLYKGPVEFPKMLYHPTGEEKVISPGEYVLSPGGRESLVGQQRELISKIVYDEGEEAAALAAGWHTTPAKSIAAANDPKRPAPKESPAQVISDKDDEIARLKRELAEAQAGKAGTGAKTKELAL